MGISWKPVQPTEIKDIKIIREVIAQIRKPIPPEVYARFAEEDRHLEGAVMQIAPEELSRKWAAIRREQVPAGVPSVTPGGRLLKDANREAEG